MREGKRRQDPEARPIANGCPRPGVRVSGWPLVCAASPDATQAVHAKRRSGEDECEIRRKSGTRRHRLWTRKRRNRRGTIALMLRWDCAG